MTTPKIIEVKKLTKEFTFPVKKTGGFFANLLNAEKKTLRAVDNISFSVHRGETIACIGPNGAGKSTTIKMLTGILYPTSGTLSVAGLNPQQNRKELAMKIGTVFGQRSQLVFNLPLSDSFELFGRIYELSTEKIRERTRTLVDLFDLQGFIEQPVRKLSLGQRMRAEVALSLLHEPEIIFLDEPTIGLDIVAKKKLRETLATLNTELRTTIFLTSHDVGDVEALAERTMVINNGTIVLDAKTEDIATQYLTEKFIRLAFKERVASVDIPEAILVEQDARSALLKVDTKKHPLNKVLGKLLRTYDLADVDVSDAPLEEVIRMIYEQHASPRS